MSLRDALFRNVWPGFAEGGEMAALVRAHDWSATPLGPIEAWPQSLRTAVDLMLGSRQPVYLAWGPELTSLYNEGYIPIVGAKHPRGLGQPFDELWSEIREEYRPLVEAVMRGEAQHFVDRPAALAGRDGVEVGYFTFSWTPLRDEAGVIRGFICNGLETTESVEAGRTFRRMFESSPTPFLVLAPDAPRFTIVEINDAYLAAVMRTREDLLGRGVFEAMPDNPTDPDATGVTNLRVSLERAIATKRPDSMPRQRFDIPHPSGGFEERWWDPVNSPLLGIGGDVEALIHHVVDVTGQHRAQERLRDSEAKLRAVIEEAPLAMVLTGTSGEILFRNPRFDKLWGRPPHATTARTYSEVYEGYHLDGRPIASEEWPGARALLKGEVVDNDVYKIDQANGQRIMCWFGGAPIRNASGDIAGAVVVFRDVSEERRTEARLRESEARFRLMADAVPQIVWITDAAGRTEFFNKQWSDYTGVAYEPATAAEIAASFVHPDDGAATIQALDAARRTGGPFVVEHRIRSRTGEYRWFLVRAEPHHDSATGEIVRWFGASTDIHDRRQAEMQLRASEARLRFLDHLADSTQTLTDATEIMALTAHLLGQHLNVSICAYADMDEDGDGFTIRGDWSAPRSVSIVGHYRLADFGRLAVENLSAGRPLVVNDNLVELAPEEAATFQNIRIAATICMPLVKEGRLTALMAIHDRVPRVWTEAELSLLREVAARSWAHVERVAATAEMRLSEERYRTLFEAVDAGFCVVEMMFDEQGRAINYCLAEINPAFERQTGLYGAAGKWVSEVAPGLERHWFDTYGRVALTGETVRFENYAEPFGRWYDVHAFRAGAPHEQRVAILFTDITERKQAGDRLSELNATLEDRVAARTAERNRLWTLTEDMLARADYQGGLSAVNPAWTQVLGWTEQELLTKPYADIIHPDDVEVTVAALLSMRETKQPTRFENRIFTTAREWKPIGWTVAPEADGVNFIAVGRDLTEYKAREQQLLETQEALRQAQKMEAMGQLTGGVAHDFNNLLTPIVGSLDMLQRRGLGGEREQRLIAGAIQSADRAKTLVQRLLAFARRQPLQPTAVDVGKLVGGMADLLASTAGPQIRIVADVTEDLPAAQADPNQLEMALLNLGVNARDATPDGGTLRITASTEIVGSGHRSKLKPGRYVLLSVADTGVGMDEATLARALEPFFSTKGIGRGTGLGLSMVHGLASQLGGALAIQSRLGVGTNIELWLPLSAAPVASSGSVINVAPAGEARGTALLVDDEELVRMSTADMLTDLGYKVVEAASAEEALRQLNNGLSPDLLVTDHLMPGMNGTELARVVQAERPLIKVLIVSGYAKSEGIAPDLPRLTKPFRNVELATSLAAISAVGPE